MTIHEDKRCAVCGRSWADVEVNRASDGRWLCMTHHLRAAPDASVREREAPARNGRAPHVPATGPIDHALGAVPAYPVDALQASMRALVEYGNADNLPAALVAGAALSAVAAAIGPRSVLEIKDTWRERAILWVANLAPRGAGKSPAQQLAFGPLHEHDAQLPDDDDDAATPICSGDTTMEALARDLAESNGAALDLDELVVLLKGLGEYKRGGGDAGRFLSLWSGRPWTMRRVAGGKGGKNGLRLRIAHPTLVICGGLQPALHELLGGDADGMRPRWLPHLAAMPEDRAHRSHPPGGGYAKFLDELVACRDRERTWALTPAGRAAFHDHRARWKQAARVGMEPASVSAALGKADVHLARVALVLAEAGTPGGTPNGAPVGPDTIERAAAIVDFTLDCWRALPEQGGMALSRRDETLDAGVSRLLGWLEEHGGEADRRQLQRAMVAGARTGGELDALLKRYEERYPGTVKRIGRDHGGPPTVVVRAPFRRSLHPTVGTADSGVGTDGNPHTYAESGTVGTADNAPADNGADSASDDDADGYWADLIAREAAR